VRLFEQPDNLLANTWIVVRIDGRGFSKYGLLVSFVAASPHFARTDMQLPVTSAKSSHEMDFLPQARRSVKHECIGVRSNTANATDLDSRRNTNSSSQMTEMQLIS